MRPSAGAPHRISPGAQIARPARYGRAAPICHRTLHATVDNKRLEAIGDDRAALTRDLAIARFVEWVTNKDPDFHALTRTGR